MDRRNPYSLGVLAPQHVGPEEPRTKIQLLLRDFILAFQLDNVFIYRSDKQLYLDPILDLH